MAQFTRATIIAVTDILDRRSQAEFHRFVLGVGMEEIANLGSVRSKCNTVVSYLLQNPEAKTQYGENLTDEVVRQVTSEAIGNCSRYSFGSREFDYVRFQEQYGELNRALLRDGFTAEGGELRRGLPHGAAGGAPHRGGAEVELPGPIGALAAAARMSTGFRYANTGTR